MCRFLNQFRHLPCTVGPCFYTQQVENIFKFFRTYHTVFEKQFGVCKRWENFQNKIYLSHSSEWKILWPKIHVWPFPPRLFLSIGIFSVWQCKDTLQMSGKNLNFSSMCFRVKISYKISFKMNGEWNLPHNSHMVSAPFYFRYVANPNMEKILSPRATQWPECRECQSNLNKIIQMAENCCQFPLRMALKTPYFG